MQRQGVPGYQAAHAGAHDERVGHVRHRPIVLVDERLQLLDQEARVVRRQRRPSVLRLREQRAPRLRVQALHDRRGHVLAEAQRLPVVDSHDDGLANGALVQELRQRVCQFPRGPEGRLAVDEEVLPVVHVQDRVSLCISFIAIWKPDLHLPRLDNGGWEGLVLDHRQGGAGTLPFHVNHHLRACPAVGHVRIVGLNFEDLS
mmetsp:Transcript_115368/g.337318  ORF Transcript_115368/g.337318 Transcript_115368/m.337318 type:complete len:202 (-) Transcript_115368:308-913(-)